jgi:hypothetical protein
MPKTNLITKAIKEFREEFNIDTVFHTDNFEDAKYIDTPYYNNAGVIEAFEQFLSSQLEKAYNSALDEIEKELVTTRKDVPWKEANNSYSQYLRRRIKNLKSDD